MGTFDVLPEQAQLRRALEQRLRSLFAGWGYGEVVTPTFESDELVRLVGAGLSTRQLYRFVDREGEVLALRPDWTPAVARLVAARLRAGPLPLRLCYVGSVFRYDRPRPDSPREFTQAGVELLGAAGELADAEVVALALEACRAAGLPDARVEIGHAGYVQGLLARLPDPAAAEAREALTARDLVRFQRAVASSGGSGPELEALVRLPEARGGMALVESERARCPLPEARQALGSLAKLLAHLQACGLEEAVGVHLGLVKDLEYYTGAVFEVYAPDAGYSLATGGRYDSLLARFGLPWPATGFAASIDRLVAVRARRAGSGRQGAPLAWVVPAGGEPAPVREAWALAAELRRRGLRAALETVRRPLGESLEAARRCGARWAVAPAGEGRGGAAAADRAFVLRLEGSLTPQALGSVGAWPLLPLEHLEAEAARYGPDGAGGAHLDP